MGSDTWKKCSNAIILSENLFPLLSSLLWTDYLPSPGLEIFSCSQDGKCVLSETLNVTTKAFLSAPYHWLKFTIEFHKQINVAEVDLAFLEKIDISLKVDDDDRFPRWQPKAHLSEWAEKKLIFGSNHDKNNITVSIHLGRDSPLNFAGAWKRGEYGTHTHFCLEISGHQVCVKIHFFAEVKKNKKVQPSRKRKRSEMPESEAPAAAEAPPAIQPAAAAEAPSTPEVEFGLPPIFSHSVPSPTGIDYESLDTLFNAEKHL